MSRTRLYILLSSLVVSMIWIADSQAMWRPSPLENQKFSLKGLISPATVADSIFLFAEGAPAGATVSYYLNQKLIATESQPPYWLGGQENGKPVGYSIGDLAIGTHNIRAVAVSNSTRLSSNEIQIITIRSINANFSRPLTTYQNHISAQQMDFKTILAHTTTQGALLTAAELQTRRNVLAMYLNWGIDPSLDHENFQSQILLNSSPKNWARPQFSIPLSATKRLFSPDAPYYQKIPSAWPRVLLPTGYIRGIQLNTTQEGDGIGYGLIFSQLGHPLQKITSQWYDDTSTRVTYTFPIATNWMNHMPWQKAGDQHIIFIDSSNLSFISAYKASFKAGQGIQALFASAPTPLNSLGDRGGSTASQFAELPVLIRPGEATNLLQPLGHAIGGPVRRTWLARVFPASGWDYGLENSIDSCSGSGYTNTGLVPYGGVIQLDPKLDLTKLGLTLPAFRILEAMQQYGYYVMDYGCTDLDIYTSISEFELNIFGGLWGYNKRGSGVQNEIEKVIAQAKLYVVAPLVKKQ